VARLSIDFYIKLLPAVPLPNIILHSSLSSARPHFSSQPPFLRLRPLHMVPMPSMLRHTPKQSVSSFGPTGFTPYRQVVKVSTGLQSRKRWKMNIVQSFWECFRNLEAERRKAIHDTQTLYAREMPSSLRRKSNECGKIEYVQIQVKNPMLNAKH